MHVGDDFAFVRLEGFCGMLLNGFNLQSSIWHPTIVYKQNNED